MHGPGADFFGDQRNSLFWAATGDQEPAIELGAQLPQAVAQELQAART